MSQRNKRERKKGRTFVLGRGEGMTEAAEGFDGDV